MHLYTVGAVHKRSFQADFYLYVFFCFFYFFFRSEYDKEEEWTNHNTSYIQVCIN